MERPLRLPEKTAPADSPSIRGASRDRRVLMLTDSLLNGGSERRFCLLAGRLPSHWDRRVVSLGDGPYGEVLREAGVRLDVRRRRARFDVSPAIDILRIVREWRPDVVHSWGWLTTPAAAPACRLLGVPLLGTIRFGGIPRHRRRTHLLSMRLADAAIANSRAGIEAFGLPPSRGFVVHNGFDPDRLQSCARPQRLPGEPFTVVMTARMAPEKDYGTFLAAARTLAAEEPGRWRFLAIGEGPDRERLVQSVMDLVEAGVVDFPGAGLEVLPWVRDADAGVLMSLSHVSPEGFANSITEYMACGLPVVASTGGGTDELVLDGRTGLIVPEADAGALVAALRRLRDHPAHARELGTAGRWRLTTELTLDRMVDETVAVYERLLAARQR